MSSTIPIDERVEQAFPAPGFREDQFPAIKHIVKFFEDGADVVLLDAPPGMGKSLVLYTALEALGGEAFYATPLKVLQDQLVNDDYMGDDVVEIKGRSNYNCILPDADPGTTVDKGKCQKESDFECPVKMDCPYYSQKRSALDHDKTVMNLSYMMAEGMVDPSAENSFGSRDYVVIDEVQGLSDWALNFVGFTLSKFTIPDVISESFDMPPEDKCKDKEYMIEWIEDEVVGAIQEAMHYYEQLPAIDDDSLDELEKLKRFDNKVQRFLTDIKEHHWTLSYDPQIRKNRPNYKKVRFEPVHVGRFLENLVWNRGNKFILSSATIPKGDWIERIGLEDRDVRRVAVGSNFPVENRPIVMDHTIGKMTYNKRKENMPDAVKKIKQISEHHEGEKGLIHCRGYNYVKMFREAATNTGNRSWYKENVFEQDRRRREESLQEWLESDKQIFMSVNMTEGIDMKGDRCRWQAVLKAEYPNMQSERVDYIVNELGDWDWYNNKAIIALEQAYGRAVRSKDDHAVMYILDESVKKMIRINAELCHEWFLEAIQGMAIDPGRAG
jgi:ATP-dependent DNA helicase DinG